MIVKFDGKPAFPCIDDNGDKYAGMLLKDYFASKAMQGLLACALDQTLDNLKTDKTSKNLAKISYNIAEALMEERERRYR